MNARAATHPDMGRITDGVSSDDHSGDAIGRDNASPAQVVLRYRRLVEATVAGYRLRSADRADAVQSTWLRFLEYRHTIRDPVAIGGWLATTARRECLRIVRGAVRETLTGPGCEKLVSPDPSPERVAVEAEEHRILRCAVADLGRRPASVVDALSFDAPATYADVARRLDLPIGSIGPTRARAMRQLRHRMASL
jgi:RNA polymerase sigma factor (sigma-70 family)